MVWTTKPPKGIRGSCIGSNGEHNHFIGCDETENSVCRQRRKSQLAQRPTGFDKLSQHLFEYVRDERKDLHDTLPERGNKIGQRVLFSRLLSLGEVAGDYESTTLAKWSDFKAQSGAVEGSQKYNEYVFGYNTREAEDYTPPVDETAPPVITPRKGSKPTVVVQQHESDEAILYRLYGGHNKKEEDWRDLTDPILHIVREYKPKLSKEIVADALGKLVQGQNSYKRRYGITPTLEFITRVKVDKEVLEDIRTIGAKAFQLTKIGNYILNFLKKRKDLQ